MPSVTDPASVVKRAAAALRTLAGSRMTNQVARCLAEVVLVDFPKLAFVDVVELLSIEKHMGQLLTEEAIDERARQIAMLEIERATAERINPDVEDEEGRALFVSQIGAR